MKKNKFLITLLILVSGVVSLAAMDDNKIQKKISLVSTQQNKVILKKDTPKRLWDSDVENYELKVSTSSQKTSQATFSSSNELVTMHLVEKANPHKGNAVVASFRAVRNIENGKISQVLKNNDLQEQDFVSVLKNIKNLIIFKKIEVIKELRDGKGFGRSFFGDSIEYLKKHYPQSIMIWYAHPYEDKTEEAFDRLCTFYKKAGGAIIDPDVGPYCASFYMKI